MNEVLDVYRGLSDYDKGLATPVTEIPPPLLGELQDAYGPRAENLVRLFEQYTDPDTWVAIGDKRVRAFLKPELLDPNEELDPVVELSGPLEGVEIVGAGQLYASLDVHPGPRTGDLWDLSIALVGGHRKGDFMIRLDDEHSHESPRSSYMSLLAQMAKDAIGQEEHKPKESPATQPEGSVVNLTLREAHLTKDEVRNVLQIYQRNLSSLQYALEAVDELEDITTHLDALGAQRAAEAATEMMQAVGLGDLAEAMLRGYFPDNDGRVPRAPAWYQAEVNTHTLR